MASQLSKSGGMTVKSGGVATERGVKILALFIGVLLPLLLFGKLAEQVARHGGFQRDTLILESIHRYATPAWDATAILISRLGDPRLHLILAAILALVLAKRDNLRSAVFLLLGVGGAALLNFAAKSLFRRERPLLWPSPAPEWDFGFPSGHAMVSLALALALVLLLWSSPKRWVMGVAALLFTVSVGFSRLYLGVHFPSDIVAGWAAALAWTTGLFFVFKPNAEPPAPEF